MDLARLQLLIDSKQVEQASAVLRKMTEEAGKTEKKTEDLTAAAKKNAETTKETNKLWERAKYALVGLAASAGTYLTVTRGIAEAQERGRQKAAFTFLLGSAKSARQEIEALQALASGAPVESSFIVGLGQDLLTAGIQGEKAQRIIRDLIDLMVARGKRPDFVTQAVQSIVRLESRGTASVQELGQLARQGIPVWEALAAKIGTDVPSAMKKAEKGAISFDEAVNAIFSNLENRVGGAAAAMEDQLGTVLIKLAEQSKNTAGDMTEAFDEAFDLRGSLKSFTAGLKSFGDTTSEVLRILGGARREGEEFSGTSYAIAAGMRAAGIGALFFIGSLVVGKLMAWITTARIAAAATLSIAGANTVAASSVSVLTAGIMALRAALLANPFTAIAVGVAAAVAGLASWNQSLNEGAAAAREQREQLAGLREAQLSMVSLREREAAARLVADPNELRGALEEQRRQVFEEIKRMQQLRLQSEFLSSSQEGLVRGILGNRGEVLKETPLTRKRDVFETFKGRGRFEGGEVKIGEETYRVQLIKTEDALSSLRSAYVELSEAISRAGEEQDGSQSSFQAIHELWLKMVGTGKEVARGVMAQVDAIRPLREQLAQAKAELKGGGLAGDILAARTKAFREVLSGGGTTEAAERTADEAERIIRELADVARAQAQAEKASESFLAFFAGDFVRGLVAAANQLKAGNLGGAINSAVSGVLTSVGMEGWTAHESPFQGIVEGMEQQITLLQQEERERARLGAVMSALNAAKSAGINLLPEEIAKISELSLALYDLAEAKRKQQEDEQKNSAGRVEVANTIAALQEQIAGYDSIGKTLGMTVKEREVYQAVESAGIQIAKASAFATEEEVAAMERLRDGLADNIKAAQDNQKLVDVSEGIASAIATPFEELIINLGSVKDAVESILLGIQQSLLRTLVTGPLQEQLSAFFQSLFSAAAAARTGSPPPGMATGPGSDMSYLGNVFRGGNKIIPHERGGIINSLSYFPMAGGRVGSVAEKEPEAVMPLARTSTGRLGVEVASQPSATSNRAPSVITNNWRIQVVGQENLGRVQRQVQRRAERYSFLGDGR